jgi:hypothetical protein
MLVSVGFENGTTEGEGLQGNAERAGLVFHEGTHQLLEAFVNKGIGYDTQNAVRIPFWVHEGLAQHLGSVKIEGTTRDGFDVYSLGATDYEKLVVAFTALHPESDGQAVALGIKEPYAFSLEELAGCLSWKEIAILANKRLAASRAPGGNPALAGLLTELRLMALVYSQSYALFQFCYAQPAGPLAQCMDRYLIGAFKGSAGVPQFAQAFRVADLDALSREWLRYIETTVMRLHQEQNKGR